MKIMSLKSLIGQGTFSTYQNQDWRECFLASAFIPLSYAYTRTSYDFFGLRSTPFCSLTALASERVNARSALTVIGLVAKASFRVDKEFVGIISIENQPHARRKRRKSSPSD